MNDRIPLLILGLGNVLLTDDGAGAAAISRLNERFLGPPDVHVLDGGTLGLSLLPWIQRADNVILVDAVRTDDPVGTLVRLDGDDVAPAVATRLSPHQVGVADVLDGARWLERYPTRVSLVGLVPDSLELGVGLSPRVLPSLDALVASIVAEAGAMGFVFQPRSEEGPPQDESGSGALDVARLAGLRV
jgi:hydrogenase maturation protease